MLNLPTLFVAAPDRQWWRVYMLCDEACMSVEAKLLGCKQPGTYAQRQQPTFWVVLPTTVSSRSRSTISLVLTVTMRVIPYDAVHLSSQKHRQIRSFRMPYQQKYQTRMHL